MRRLIEASCKSDIGKIRKNNEDNFYFDGKCLEPDNEGLKHPVYLLEPLKNGLCLAVFDGMGGENFGEVASFAAARAMQQTERKFADFFIPERKYLNRLVAQINNDVVKEAERLKTRHIGSTMAALYFTSRSVYVCNLGDSRAYRLRNGEFLQISHDHVDSRPVSSGRKAALTQHLGIDSEEVLIEPYIAKGELKRGDCYIVCTDGLTDMLTNFEIADILISSKDTDESTNRLVSAALEKGGKDNVTVIVCRII